MRVDRALARAVLPPLLALGLVAAVISPLSASQPPVARSQVERPAPTSGSGASVGIPPVAFTAQVALRDGRLRTPVVLADDTVSGSATVEGATTNGGCSTGLVVGAPAWLECSLVPMPGQSPRVVVTLSDGRIFERVISR